MGQCKHCGNEVREGMRFCSSCGAPQEAGAAEAEMMARGSREVTEKSIAAVAGENAVMGTGKSTATGQEAHSEDKSPALTATVEGVTEGTATTIAGKSAVTGIEESTAAEQKAPGEAMHPIVPRPSIGTSEEPVTTTAEGDSVLPTLATEAVGEPVATVAGENAVTGTEGAVAAEQEASGETTKRRLRCLRAAFFTVAAVAVAVVGATMLLHHMTAMTGERFVRMQTEVLQQEAAPFGGLGAVLGNGFSSDFALNMQTSRGGLLAFSRSGNENYMFVAKTLQRGIQAEMDSGRHLETAVLNLRFGTDDSTKLNFDCFLDSERFGYRIPQVGKQVFVLSCPEVLRQYSDGARFSTAELATLASSKTLLSASAVRYGRVLVVAFKPKEIKVRERAYTPHVLKRQLDHEMKGEYTIYTWNPGRGMLETLFRSLAAEMREDKNSADWYSRRQEVGEELVTAFSVGRGRATYFSNVADYVEEHAADQVETLRQQNLRQKLVMQRKGVATIRVVDNGERPLFCYEQDQVGDTLYHSVSDEVFPGTSAEEYSKKKNSYEGRVIGRLAMFGDTWLWGFRLYYSKVPLDRKPSVLGLPNDGYRYTYFDADQPDRKYAFEVKEKWGCSVYELDDGYDKFTLAAARKDGTEKPTGREVDISNGLSGSGKSLPQKKFSNIIEEL